MRKERHTVTLDREVVRRANCLRRDQSLSAFINDAVAARNAQLERSAYESQPETADERAWAEASAGAFVGDDGDDWDALLA